MLAATLSGVGALATYVWSESNKPRVVAVDQTPLARLVFSANEVQRRQSGRLIWESLTANEFKTELLYAGEAVRTGISGEARIQFIEDSGAGTIVQLEPESVLELQGTREGINLDFLKGGLFIAATSDSQKITVQSGGESIEVKKSEVKVTKASSKAAMDLNVVKGEAPVVKRSGQATTMPQTPKLKVVGPLSDKPIWIRPQSSDKVAFTWQPVGDDYAVRLEMGASRSSLEQVKAVEPVSGKIDALQAPIAVGKAYFRLVGKPKSGSGAEIASSVFRIDVKPLHPPELLEPLTDAAVSPQGPKSAVQFKWANAGSLENFILEISETPDFKKLAHSSREGARTEATIAVADVGERYWRVSGQIPGTNRMVSSLVRKIVLIPKDKQPLLAPIGLVSDPVAKISLLGMRETGIRLEWQPVKGATKYQVTIESDEVDPSTGQPKSYKTQAPGLRTSVRSLPAGDYQWRVAAQDEYGSVSPPSEASKFSVEGVPLLSWADKQTTGRSIYKSAKPALKLAWERGPGKPVKWKVRVSKEREPASDQGWTTVAAPELTTTLESPGSYFVEVEALDEKGVVLARTPQRIQEVLQAPPPEAPAFADSVPEEIQADERGTAKVAWKPAEDAKEYVLTVKSEDGKNVRTLRSREARAELSKLRTGRYKVSLQSIDGLGRTGPEGAPRTLKVPEYSEVVAPKLKNIQVK